MPETDATVSPAVVVDRLGAIPGSTEVHARPDGLWVSAPELDVPAMGRAMTDLGFRLCTMTGLPADGGETTVIYHWVHAGHAAHAVHLKTCTRSGALPSLATLVRPASWSEREIHDFFGAAFTGHPNLAPLLRPSSLKEGFFRDAPAAAPAEE
jgi:NADH:ubiquinone oxidoreductase subunit C